MRLTILVLFLVTSVLSVAQPSVVDISLMNVYRYSHQAANLNSSYALVAGGWDQNQVLSSAEIYDVENEIWDFTESMSVPRTNFALCALDANYAIAAGGWDGTTSNHASTEIYDFVVMSWMDGPSLSVGRSNLNGIKLLDGTVLFTGGFDGLVDQSSVDVYDPISNTMSAGANMNSARSSHATTLLNDGRVMVIGGFNPELNFQLIECEIYNPFLDEWTEVAPLNIGRDNLGAVTLSNGDVLVTGGRFFNGFTNLFEGQSIAEVYSVENNTWTEISTLEGQSYHHLFAFDDIIVSSNGADQTGNGVTITYASSQQFENATVIGLTNNMGEDEDGRYRSAICVLNNGYLVCGGDANEQGTAAWWGLASSVEEVPLPSWSVFPNPAVDVVVLNGPIFKSWRIIDLKGSEVLQGSSRTIHVQSLLSGQYILEIQSEGLPSRTNIQIVH